MNKMTSITIIFAACLLLLGLSIPLMACCTGSPPGDPNCYVCQGGAWVLKAGADCGSSDDCGPCYDCNDCNCEYRCDPDCEDCNDGVCECNPSCCKNWSPGSAPAGGSIAMPPDNAVYLAGARVTFTCSRATDSDSYTRCACCGGPGSENDTLSSNHPRWFATAGSFPSGNIGTSVIWQAPDGEQNSIMVSIYDDDLPNSVSGCDTGSRGDPETLQDTHVIKTVIPEPDQVSFVGNAAGEEHDIYNVSDPVWKRVDNPDNPASYTMDKKVRINAKFWDSETLTKSESVDVDVETTAGYTHTEDSGITFGTTWPSASSTHLSDSNTTNYICRSITYLKWKYKVPSGSNNWIEMTNTSGPHRVYHVYDAPKCSYSDYTKDNIYDAVLTAWGETTESNIASKANDNVADGVFYDPNLFNCICGAGFQVNFDAAMGSYPPPPKGMCCCRAEGLNCVLQVLGIGPYTHDYVNEKPEPNPTGDIYEDYYCSVCDDYFDRCYWDGFWNNWEGVVKAGGTGSTCYAPANGSISIDEGTYSAIDSAIATDCGYYWTNGDNFSETCPHLGPP